MKIHMTLKRLVLLSFVMSISSWGMSSYAEDRLVEGAMILAPVEERGSVALGTVEDTLKACLARISDSATAGDRMLAQQSCEREEMIRRLTPLAPKF